MALLALLPSPLLNGAVWEPVASVLRALGCRAEAVYISAPAPANAKQALGAYLDALPEGEEYVLVPHSNAGLYVPALTEQRHVTSVAFVDASLPPVDGGDVPNMRPEYLESIAAKADHQRLLPVWTQWWNEQEVAALFPDSALREAIVQQQRRLPLAYFEDAVTVRPGWANRPCAYLAFGDGYATEAAAARRLGWPTEVIDGKHLEMLVHPKAVADAILALLHGARDSQHHKR